MPGFPPYFHFPINCIWCCPPQYDEPCPQSISPDYSYWTVYDYVVYAGDHDPFGPTALGQYAQDIANTTVPDFVPFSPSNGLGNLNVYRSHFTQFGVAASNGSVSPAGVTLGAGTEAGGSMGGLVLGPFPATGTVKYSTVTNKFTYDSGSKFSAWASTTSSNGNTISIPAASNGPTFTIHGPVTNSFAVNPAPTGLTNGQIVTYTYNVQTPGVLSKKQ